jgi:hypothetical protein
MENFRKRGVKIVRSYWPVLANKCGTCNVVGRTMWAQKKGLCLKRGCSDRFFISLWDSMLLNRVSPGDTGRDGVVTDPSTWVITMALYWDHTDPWRTEWGNASS